MKTLPLSARSEATTRRTYNRPLDDDGSRFETWEETIHRSHYEHHKRLWEDAGGKPDFSELNELVQLGLDRSGLVSGRTLWLGGTPYAYERSASQFNCSGLCLDTVYDMVDAFWLLLNGAGVGAVPNVGTLHGYYRRIPELKIIPSERDKDFKGHRENRETLPSESNQWTWTVVLGDSAESWAKALGKLLASPRGRCDRLVLDFSNVRGAGGRLKGYGWICNGYKPMAEAMEAAHAILNRQAGNLLTSEDIIDIFNWCGMVLSSRRAAESVQKSQFDPSIVEFSTRKKNYWQCKSCGSHNTRGNLCLDCGDRNTNQQRRQSNNSILFWQKPSVDDIADLLIMNLDGGEPGFVNAEALLRKCPWYKTLNPCYEIALPSHGFCNLVSLCLPTFGQDFNRLERAVWVMARANYRQTCVNLHDGVLQPRWHQTNEALRLCGVSFTGIVQAPWLSDYQIRRLRNAAIAGSYSMADELGLPRPKAVCTGKPEGSRSKISGRVGMEVGEGMHLPLGRYIFNWINFSMADPLVTALESSGYKVIPSPSDPNNVLIRFPVAYPATGFKNVNGKWINAETSIDQLRRYKRWNSLWADHNISSTISLSREEVPETAKWLHDNWEQDYIATAFLQRTDPTKTAKDIGQPYLPQEVVTEQDYLDVESQLKPVDWQRFHKGWHDISDTSGCEVTGSCPTK